MWLFIRSWCFLNYKDTKKSKEIMAKQRKTKPGQKNLRPQNVSPKSAKSREFDQKNQSMMGFISELEKNIKLVIQYTFKRQLNQIETQVFLDPSITIKIAKERGIIHPPRREKFVEEKMKYPMSTDFLIHFSDKSVIAVDVKHTSDLGDYSLDKLEIAREYWSLKRINWVMLTENELNSTLLSNLLKTQVFANEAVCSQANKIKDEIKNSKQVYTIKQLIEKISKEQATQKLNIRNSIYHLLNEHFFVLPEDKFLNDQSLLIQKNEIN